MSLPVHRYLQHKSNSNDKKDDEYWDASPVKNYPWLYIGSLSAAESHDQLKRHNITRILTVARRLPVATMPDFIVEHCIVNIDDHPRANFLGEATKQCCNFIDIAYSSAFGCTSASSPAFGSASTLQEDHANVTGITATKTSSSDDDDNADHLDTSLHDHDTNNTTNHHPPSILVHCASGISRSATAILTWLMNPKQGSLSLSDALSSIREYRPSVRPNIGFMMQLQVLEKYNGTLSKAIVEWNANTQTEIYELVSSQRQKANDMHLEIDELEVQIQTFRSSKMKNNLQNTIMHPQNGNDPLNKISSSSNNNDSYVNDTIITLPYLLRQLNQFSDRLDCDYHEHYGIGDVCSLPEDRVTKMILKSVRSKVERLFTLLTNLNSNSTCSD